MDVRGRKDKASVVKPAYIVDGLSCGEAGPVTIVAFDIAGNRSDRVTTTVSAAPCADTQPPSTPSGFRQVATTSNAVVLAWNPSTDNVGVVGYGVYSNNRLIVSTAEPTVPLSGLACGSKYPYQIDAADASGNHSPLGTVFVVTAACSTAPADTTAPSTPTGLAVSNVTQTGLALSWSPSSDNVGVTGYDVYRNGSKVASSSSTSLSQTGLSCGTSFMFAVAARDAAGNSSQQTQRSASTAACSTAPADTTAPSTPTGLAVSNVTQTGLALSWSPSSDNVGVTGYDVYRNGSKVASSSSTSLSQTGLSCGTSFMFAVAARDAAGNSSQQTQRSASTAACSTAPADTTAPSTPTGLAVSNVTQTGLALSWSPSSDNVGVTGYDVYRNGSKVASSSSTSLSQTGLSCGTSFMFAVAARDAAGNSSQQTQRSASTAACSTAPADTTAPTPPASLGIAGATTTSVSLVWSASTDNVGVAGYRIYLNGVQKLNPTQLSATISSLVCGTAYGFEVDAYDASGNGSARASVIGATAACPDTQPPTAPTNLISTSRTATSIALSWAASIGRYRYLWIQPLPRRSAQKHKHWHHVDLCRVDV